MKKKPTNPFDTPLLEAPEEWEEAGTDAEGYQMYRVSLFEVQSYAIDYKQRFLRNLSDWVGRPTHDL